MKACSFKLSGKTNIYNKGKELRIEISKVGGLK